MNIGPIEATLVVSSFICALWVFYDAQKLGYVKIHAILWGLFSFYFFFPLGFIVYFGRTRIEKINKSRIKEEQSK